MHDDPALASLPQGATGRAVVVATNYRLTPNSTAFDVHAAGRGVALLAEAYLPGDFRAELDGRPAPIVRLNHAFKGVLIQTAGDHRVKFTYRPRRFTPALLAAGLGLALLSGSFWFARRAPRAA